MRCIQYPISNIQYPMPFPSFFVATGSGARDYEGSTMQTNKQTKKLLCTYGTDYGLARRRESSKPSRGEGRKEGPRACMHDSDKTLLASTDWGGRGGVNTMHFILAGGGGGGWERGVRDDQTHRRPESSAILLGLGIGAVRHTVLQIFPHGSAVAPHFITFFFVILCCSWDSGGFCDSLPIGEPPSPQS